jgi:hypothetical protein
VSAAVTDLRLRPSVRVTEGTSGVRVACRDCGDAKGVRDVDEARDWAADHEGCQAVVDAAHGEALIEEARRLPLRLISRSGLVHIADLQRSTNFLCGSRSVMLEATALPADCVDCAQAVSYMQDFAYRARHGAMQGYNAAAPSDARHWSRLTGQEQARWLDWACSDDPRMPAIDETADRVELDAVARWAADDINIGKAMAELLDHSTGVDPAPTVQVPPVPDEVRLVGWRAMVDAAETTTDLAQIFARTLDAVLLPLYAAWLGGKELVEVPAPDDVMEFGAGWGTAVEASVIGGTPTVYVIGRAFAADDAELRGAEMVAAARWGRDRADELGAERELAEAEQSGGAS